MSQEDFDEMYKLATERGKKLEELDKKNAKRRAKGLKPLLDDQAKADLAVRRRRYKTDDATTVDGAEALKLFRMRKEQMAAEQDDIGDDDEVVQPDKPAKPEKPAPKPQARKPYTDDDSATERAVREAEAVRRVEDMKNGRINHAGVWSDEGNRTEGGDETKLSDDQAKKDEPKQESRPAPKAKGKTASVSRDELEEFKNDLYGRLKISFEELEKSMSDLQGRVSEIVTASTPSHEAEEQTADGKLESLLRGTTPITFNVKGTRMTCNAVKVFYNSPCITILSRIGSATIQPEAGTRIRLSYESDGRKYEDDPVTFVGLRVDLEELGFSLVGFVRDAETDLVDVPAEE